ncbi:MAG: Ni-sirohydrochlorin a,c-diamide reductive cyclase catalytic subunit [Methanomassiliicoccaceae archaeon]|jgi:putative methanogenesis marker 13 metalloprotein|nr:Ni-sirohydrochlorin a,c-diamide reductive cyclase catalytic subunit [Methanomassiliicoccaceae archaeon]
MNPIHPRPNPIVAAMYTLRDMDVDVIVMHGPSGCGFMASRMLEEAGVRVVTTGMGDNDLVFGAGESLIRTLRAVSEKFDPRTVAVIGTCASMIIGEDMGSSIRRAGIGGNVFPVDCHGCMGDNTLGAAKAMEAGCKAGIVSPEEAERQVRLMRAATNMEKRDGMASKDYLSPVRGPTKLKVAGTIIDALRNGRTVAVAMLAKKELAYRFADIFLAVDAAREELGGDIFFTANLDTGAGLPRIRRYAIDITNELARGNVSMDETIGGLDEYAVVGERMRDAVERNSPDLLVLTGIPHAYPGYSTNDVLITDPPRQLANYLNAGCSLAVGEIASHSMVMNTRRIVETETGNTIRELLRGRP